jgi:BirA family biotin operon repressor/biotin-[acetyl-CoA-carboxylase] ligase
MINLDKIKSEVLSRFSEELEVFTSDEVSSTNRQAIEHNYESKKLALFLTSHQTEGRGQRHRSWEDEKGNSLLFSIGVQSSFQTPQLLPVLAGLVLQNCLGFDYEEGLSLKWPNDLLWDGAKLAGILCESQTGSGKDIYVIGVGINWKSAPFEGSACISDLEAEMDCSIDPAGFICDFLESFIWDLKSLNSDEYRSRLIANWENQSGFIGAQVKLESDDNSLSEETYKVHSMDINGFLRLEESGGEIKTLSNERLKIV